MTARADLKGSTITPARTLMNAAIIRINVEMVLVPTWLVVSSATAIRASTLTKTVMISTNVLPAMLVHLVSPVRILEDHSLVRTLMNVRLIPINAVNMALAPTQSAVTSRGHKL